MQCMSVMKYACPIGIGSHHMERRETGSRKPETWAEIEPRTVRCGNKPSDSDLPSTTSEQWRIWDSNPRPHSGVCTELDQTQSSKPIW